MGPSWASEGCLHSLLGFFQTYTYDSMLPKTYSYKTYVYIYINKYICLQMVTNTYVYIMYVYICNFAWTYKFTKTGFMYINMSSIKSNGCIQYLQKKYHSEIPSLLILSLAPPNFEGFSSDFITGMAVQEDGGKWISR